MAKIKRSEIIIALEQALKDAEGADNWHRHGEGYGGLRTDIQALINQIRDSKNSC